LRKISRFLFAADTCGGLKLHDLVGDDLIAEFASRRDQQADALNLAFHKSKNKSQINLALLQA
jgi:hypothetical protein